MTNPAIPQRELSAPERRKQTLKLMFLGLPLLVLVFTGLAVTAFLSVNLLVQGVRETQIGSLVLGTLLTAMWLLMLMKTLRARRAQ